LAAITAPGIGHGLFTLSLMRRRRSGSGTAFPPAANARYRVPSRRLGRVRQAHAGCEPSF